MVALPQGTFTLAQVAAEDPALDIAETALELKCTSEEFSFSFWERCKRPFQWFCFCEENLRSSCFSWRPVRKPICRALAGGRGGRMLGEAPSRLDRTLDGMGHTGWLLGLDQPLAPWKWPGHQGGSPLHWPGLGWTDRMVVAFGI